MIICEFEFEIPDQKNPKYSFAELDFYAWIPAKFRESDGDHRLSLRKNLQSQKYEVFKHFHRTDIEEIVLETEDLQVALDKIHELWNHYHSSWSTDKRELDLTCMHKSPQMAIGCSAWKRKAEELKKGD